jgi:hypothetical protein
MKKTIIIILFLLPIISNAQDGLGLWSGVSIEKKLNKKFSVQVNGQARFVENISYVQTYLGELGVSYKIIKNLEVSGYYRFINRRKDETKDFKNRHRFYGDLAYDQKLGPIKFAYRIRYQHQFRDNDGEVGFDTSYLRNKLEISYPNKSDFTPYVSGDLFYEINGTGFDQLRPKAGLSYKINKKNSIDASIFTNVDLVGTETANPIIGLTYKLKL